MISSLIYKLKLLFDSSHNQQWDGRRYIGRSDAIPSPHSPIRFSSDRLLCSNPAFDIKLFKATGGTILEFTPIHSYNDSTSKYSEENNKSTIYIISDDENVAEKFSQILTLENLKL